MVGFSPDGIHHLYNSVSISYFWPETASGYRWYERLRFHISAECIDSVGMVDRQKLTSPRPSEYMGLRLYLSVGTSQLFSVIPIALLEHAYSRLHVGRRKREHS